MKLAIFISFALLGFSKARRVSTGPQIFSDLPSTSQSSQVQKTDKEDVARGITLYFTPTEIKALKNTRDSDVVELANIALEGRQQWTAQNYYLNQHLNTNTESEQNEQDKKQVQATTPQTLYYKGQSDVDNNNNQRINFDLTKSNPWEQPNTQTKHFFIPEIPRYYSNDGIGSQIEKEDKKQGETQKNEDNGDQSKYWVSFNPASIKEQSKIQEQKQSNRISEPNHVQLKGLLGLSKRVQQFERSNQNHKDNIQLNVNYENNNSDIEKQIIEYLLRNNQDLRISGQDFQKATSNNQRPPILIHKQVSVTKHQIHPVTVKEVQIPVPAPVFVPIPEPYEVKVPQPYPVPRGVVKHIPVPIAQYSS